MNQEQLTYLLDHPKEISAEQTRELEKIIAKYPYFQAARAIRLKGLKEFQKTTNEIKDEVNATAEDVKSSVEDTEE